MLNQEVRKNFIDAMLKVDKFLKERFPESLSSLSNKEIKKYPNSHDFVRGWKITKATHGVNFNILIPRQFPYAIPRIALEDSQDSEKDLSKELPHIEDRGLLCLPALNPSSKLPVELINAQLCQAIQYLEDFHNKPEHSQEDFQKEFISYWNRKKSDNTYVLSLINPYAETHEIYTSKNAYGFLATDSVGELKKWYKNLYPLSKDLNIERGLFIKATEPPTPPFFDSVESLLNFIRKAAPEAEEKFKSYSLNVDPYLLVISADGISGKGLIAVRMEANPSAPNPVKGFRGTALMPMDVRMARFSSSTRFSRHHVKRVDHDWIHGRGIDRNQETLKTSSVCIVGCGSLGSHVAIALAQAGVGKMILVDFDEVEAANVGRHALGIKHLGSHKSTSLEHELNQRFPHLTIHAARVGWEELFRTYPEHIDEFNLIISTMGEWRGEGPLNEWGISRNYKIPILYGWLEARAVAAHALYIRENSSCLECIVNERGEMRSPDSHRWPDLHGLESEPACGSVFQPYGPIDLSYASAMVADVALSSLLSKLQKNIHKVYATSTLRIHELGGEWTDIHHRFRPQGFLESFQYERPIDIDTDCSFHLNPHE